jgi:hypothetical protein
MLRVAIDGELPAVWKDAVEQATLKARTVDGGEWEPCPEKSSGKEKWAQSSTPPLRLTEDKEEPRALLVSFDKMDWWYADSVKVLLVLSEEGVRL